MKERKRVIKLFETCEIPKRKWWVAKGSCLSRTELLTLCSTQSSPAPGGQRTDVKRRANAKSKAQAQSQTPTSTRSAGFGGSSSSLLKLYTDEAQGLRIDPLAVLVLAVVFIFSVIALHVIAKLTGKVFS